MIDNLHASLERKAMKLLSIAYFFSFNSTLLQQIIAWANELPLYCNCTLHDHCTVHLLASSAAQAEGNRTQIECSIALR